MARNWTEKQKEAIECRDRTLLVSAAAGSGKTAVLTERVIASLTQPETPLDISRLLVVTFTQAAAKELKERIAAALAEAVKTTPGNRHLAKQIRLLPGAEISTIHSFCLSLLKRYPNLAGIRPGIRVADETETQPLMAAILNQLVEDGYAGLIPGVTKEELIALIDEIGCVRRPAVLIEYLYDFYQNTATTKEGVSILGRFAKEYEEDAQSPFDQTKWWGLIGEELSQEINHARHKADVLEERLAGLAFNSAEFLQEIRSYYNGFWTGLEEARKEYRTCREHILSFSPPAFPRKTKASSAASAAQELLKMYKDTLSDFGSAVTKKWIPNYFAYEEAEWQEMLKIHGERIRTVAALVEEFSRRYGDEMKKRGAVDFNQMERLTYELLSKDGKPTPLCREIAAGYDAIYIDEYQDVSPLQHAIFEMVSQDRNRFMVGDIKQSIYRFRHADPGIFASLKKNMPPLNQEDGEQSAASLFMSHNFRCDKPVVDFVNRTFTYLFGYAGESIAYTPEDNLCYAKNEDGLVVSTPVKCAVFDPADLSPEDVLFSEEGDDLDDRVAEEAMWVAKEIHTLLTTGKLRDGVTPIKPSHIAILLRGTKADKVAPFLTALASWGIPVNAGDTTDFFLNPEVQLALCLLSTIDNPRRDVYVTGAVCSPIWGFTPDDIVNIRKEAPPESCLYEGIVSYVEHHPDFEKGVRFLTQLASFQKDAESIPVWQLIDRLYRETPILALAGKESPGGETNLKLLFNYARTSESITSQGLYGFLGFVRGQIELGRTFKTPAKEGGEAVQIMTMHASKGLEFPVVFVSRLGDTFNEMDLRNDILLNNEYGPAMKLLDPTGKVKVDTPLRKLLVRVAKRAGVEEEMRLLYVALTRARERLILTGTCRGVRSKVTPYQNMLENLSHVNVFPDEKGILSQNSMLRLVLLPLLASKEVPPVLTCQELGGCESLPTECLQTYSQEEMETKLKERFSFVYPHKHLNELPKKLSVSKLSPGLLDASEEEATPLLEDAAEKPNITRLPLLFLEETEAPANEKGIATHLFMQFCNFERFYKIGVEEELAILQKEGFLDAHTASLIRKNELETFRLSPLMTAILSAKEVKRELRFHMRFPAAEFTKDPKKKVALQNETLYVQGVIDAVIIDREGNLTLVDYKTDRLTKEERKDTSLAAKKLRDRHGEQLAYYTAAVSHMFGTPPKSILLYSLHLGDTVPL